MPSRPIDPVTANRTGDRIAVRLWLAPLTQRQIAQLPPYLAAAYPEHLAQR